MYHGGILTYYETQNGLYSPSILIRPSLIKFFNKTQLLSRNIIQYFQPYGITGSEESPERKNTCKQIANSPQDLLSFLWESRIIFELYDV